MRRRLALLTAALLLVPLLVAAPAGAAAGLRLGSLTLARCDLGTSTTAWCGSLAVPLCPGPCSGQRADTRRG